MTYVPKNFKLKMRTHLALSINSRYLIISDNHSASLLSNNFRSTTLSKCVTLKYCSVTTKIQHLYKKKRCTIANTYYNTGEKYINCISCYLTPERRIPFLSRNAPMA